MKKLKEKEKINNDKIKIKLLIQRSGRYFTNKQIKEIQEFLDVKGNITKLKNWREIKEIAEHYTGNF